MNERTQKGEDSYRNGLIGESLATFFLRVKGYRILARRYTTPVGEIDIVASKRGALVFVEVKARQTLDLAVESVTPQMKKRVTRGAEFYLSQNPHQANMEMRFDVVGVAPPFWFRHLVNAWRPQA